MSRGTPAASSPSHVALSFVIPVYNGSETVGGVVDSIRAEFGEVSHEIVLVNDGSRDESEETCRRLVEEHRPCVRLLQLARNFGEHSAVLAGLRVATGELIAVLDDDGQNPPEEVRRMWSHQRTANFDVVYGRYREKHHHWFRNLGSWLNNRMATRMLKKPKHIYLSSFKIMTRFIAEQITSYRGPFPYIDGLIFRVTRHIGQVDVEHRDRVAGVSGYTLSKLVKLWLNMFLGFSIAPLRLSIFVGFAAASFSLVLLAGIIADKVWLNPNVPVGIPTVLTCISLFAGVQLMMLGMVGEYVGRIFLEQNGMPQSIVRYVYEDVAPIRETLTSDSGTTDEVLLAEEGPHA